MVGKFLSKYILEVIPSIVATVIGAYIVTHYINAKSDADKPKAAVMVPADTAKEGGKDKAAKPAEASASKAAKAEPSKLESAKSESVKAESAKSEPAEPRRHQPMLRAKAAPAAPVESTAKAEDTRDANEIAREAIARLRGSEQPQPSEAPRAQEAVRVQEAPRPQERARVNVTYTPSPPVQPPMPAPVVAAPPPSVSVVPPLNEVTVAPAPQPPMARINNPPGLTPPADIPSRPLDLRTNERTSVAEDIASTAKGVVSSAKSVFRAVIPDTN